MMLAARGAIRASGAGLPYDAEVEYLESSGTQYINTGIKPGPNTRVEITFAMTTFTANCGLFGARGTASADNNSYNLFIISNSGARVRWDWSGSGQYQTTEAETSAVATYVLGATGGNITRDGTTVMAVSSSKTAIDYPLYVFNMNNVGTPFSTGANARFWSVKIYEGQTLVFDAIPVRKRTVGYLYDRVSGKLFGNAGTGDFTCGPDVVPVEWLQSNATSYISTGIIPDDTYGMEVTGYTTQTVDSAWIGTRNGSNQRCFMGYSPSLGFYYGWNGRQDIQYTTGVWSTASMNLYNSRKNMMDGTEVGSIAETLGAQYRAIYLFALTANGTLGLKLKNALITKGSDDVQKLVSVRVGTGSTWEGAMMDTITRRIYRNAGTGAFAYGNDLKYPIPA